MFLYQTVVSVLRSKTNLCVNLHKKVNKSSHKRAWKCWHKKHTNTELSYSSETTQYIDDVTCTVNIVWTVIYSLNLTFLSSSLSGLYPLNCRTSRFDSTCNFRSKYGQPLQDHVVIKRKSIRKQARLQKDIAQSHRRAYLKNSLIL